MSSPETRLRELLALPHEIEWVEFKEDNFHPGEIGEYIAALSNAAALAGRPAGYLVWGVEDGTHEVVGTTYQPRRQKGKGNEDLEPWLNRLLSPRVRFEILEFEVDGKPVVMFEIQPANTVPVAFQGQRFVRIGSHKKPLGEYPERERELWRVLSTTSDDWTKQICSGATLDDLDPAAIAFARRKYREKYPALAAEAEGWSDRTFLNKAKVCINGQITRTAILLLGRSEAEHFLSPGIARVSWILKDERGLEKDYQHFGPPLILAVDQMFARVRNLTYRYLPDASLFPTEISQYDPWVIRETLHNCIAHQDYSKGGKINVVETPHALLFTNVGRFLPGTVEKAILDGLPEIYANRFLVDAMVNLNMIDTIGSGIRRMFTKQWERRFPMPDYDLTEPERVKVRIPGEVIDDNYTRMLLAKSDLELPDIIALDKVQKRRPVSDDEFRRLKSQRLIEGRRPNLFVSAQIAAATESKADYIKNRGFNQSHYRSMVVAYLQEFGTAERKDLDKLLLDKLSSTLSDEQKFNFITNLLQKMRREGVVRSGGPGRRGTWSLV
jgi:ATP-dependent DNA helicase RecG